VPIVPGLSPTLSILSARFPGRVIIGVKEVAEVMHERGDKAAQEAVRAGLRRGDIVPGAKHMRGKWLVPLAAFANWVDSLAVASPPQEPLPDRPASRRVVSTRSTAPVYPARRAAQQARSAAFFSALLWELTLLQALPLATSAAAALTPLHRVSPRRRRPA